MLQGKNGLPAEDLRKLHSEINQLVHQRFLVSTAAITVFGLVGAWMVGSRPQDGTSGEVGPFVYASAILLICLLGLLFSLSFCLKRTVRTLSSYLIVTEKSAWEQDWFAYRKKWVYWGYSKPLSVVFLALGVCAFGFPFLFILVYDLSPRPWWGLGLNIAFGVIYLAAVCLYGFFELGDREAEAISKWEKLRDDPALGLPPPAPAPAVPAVPPAPPVG